MKDERVYEPVDDLDNILYMLFDYDTSYHLHYRLVFDSTRREGDKICMDKIYYDKLYPALDKDFIIDKPFVIKNSEGELKIKRLSQLYNCIVNKTWTKMVYSDLQFIKKVA